MVTLENVLKNSTILNKLSAKELAHMMTISKNVKNIINSNPSLVKKLKNANLYYRRLANVIRTAPREEEYKPTRRNITRGKIIRKYMGGLQNFNQLGSFIGRSIKFPSTVVRVPSYSYLNRVHLSARILENIRRQAKGNLTRNANNRSFGFSIGPARYTLTSNGMLTRSVHSPTEGMRTSVLVRGGVKLSNILTKANRRRIVNM
jgi:hypothetical protein